VTADGDGFLPRFRASRYSGPRTRIEHSLECLKPPYPWAASSSSAHKYRTCVRRVPLSRIPLILDSRLRRVRMRSSRHTRSVPIQISISDVEDRSLIFFVGGVRRTFRYVVVCPERSRPVTATAHKYSVICGTGALPRPEGRGYAPSLVGTTYCSNAAPEFPTVILK
jgi:hypothetical protein